MFFDWIFAKIDFDFKIDEKQFMNLYFLVDGIYPKLSRFVKTISVPLSSKFAKWQESVRKNIESGFAVLLKIQIYANTGEVTLCWQYFLCCQIVYLFT